MPRVKKSKANARLRRVKVEARTIIEGIAEGSLGPYIGYRGLYRLFCGSSGVHDDLREFFRIPGVEPDGLLRVDVAFRTMIRSLAKDWLVRHPTL